MLGTIAAVAILQNSPVAVPVVWTGQWSKIKKAEISIIATQWDWMSVWMRHTGKEKLLKAIESNYEGRTSNIRYDYYNEANVPEVDFKRNFVLALIGGDVHQQAGYSLLDCYLDEKVVVVRYIPRYFSVISQPDKPNFWVRSPFGFFLLPRGAEKLRLEEGIVKDKFKPVTEFRVIKEMSIS